jgi:DNA-binding Xre family transcriptional regulator
MRFTLQLSGKGKEEIERARTQYDWSSCDKRWLRAASRLLEPTKDWDAIWKEETVSDILGISESTLKKFRRRQSIRRKNFIALCEAVGVDWQKVVNLDCPAIIGNPPDVSKFYGRTTALKQLQDWAMQKRLIVLHGRAGIGKSCLARQVMDNVAEQFEVLIWRSLESALPLSEWLDKLMSYFPQMQDQPDKLEAFMSYLAEHKCLIVLDQWETILRNGGSGQYQPDYQAYQDFLQRVVGDRHQSCVLLLSREKLKLLGLKHSESSVQFLKLEGLTYLEDRAFLEGEKLLGKEDELKIFIERYNNPFILKTVAAQVREVQNGRVSIFVDPQVSVALNAEDISGLMDGEFKELSQLEQDIVYWLAIWRSPISYDQLWVCIVSPITKTELICALDSLISRHSIIKIQSDPDSEYWLEPVTLKYVTHRFVQRTAKEIFKAIQQQDFQIAKLINSHSLVIGNDVQLNNEQFRRVVKPMFEQLMECFSRIQLQEKLKKLKSQLIYEAQLYTSKGYLENNIKFLISK